MAAAGGCTSCSTTTGCAGCTSTGNPKTGCDWGDSELVVEVLLHEQPEPVLTDELRGRLGKERFNIYI
jgi:hypothetical protein